MKELHFKNQCYNLLYLMSPIILSIEGNIGAGKSTILETIHASKTIVYLKEPVDIWSQIKDTSGETILAKYYKDPLKYAFPFQILALTTRLSEIRRTIRENPDCKIILCERSLETDRQIFAKMLYDEGKIDDVSYQIYQKLFDTNQLEIPLGGVIYLDTPSEICFERIKKRARVGEESIPLEYLQKCDNYHKEWLNQPDLPYPVVTINDSVSIESFDTFIYSNFTSITSFPNQTNSVPDWYFTL